MKYLKHSALEVHRVLTPSKEVKHRLVFRPSRKGHCCHVMQDNAFDKHPQKHGRLAVFDQSVEKLT